MPKQTIRPVPSTSTPAPISPTPVSHPIGEDMAAIADTRHRLHKAPLNKRGVKGDYSDEGLVTTWNQRPAPKGSR